MWVRTDNNDHFNQGLRERYHLLLVLEGAGIVEIDGTSFPILSPAFYCLNESESFRLHPDCYITSKSIYFHPNLINDRFMLEPSQENVAEFTVRDIQDQWYLDPFRKRQVTEYRYNPNIVPIDPSMAKHAEYLLDETKRHLTEQPDAQWPCRTRSILMELLTLLRRPYSDALPQIQPILGTASETLQPVVQYLHIHYKDKIKIEDLTKLFHTNKTTLNQHFKLSTGMSIMAYLNSIRMQMAGYMLRNTLLPSDEVMNRVGLRDNAHFIRTFRKHSGLSPAEFRNLYCRMPQ